MTNPSTDALARLREWLKPGDTVYTILRHVSRSGMQRTIQLVHFDVTSAQGILNGTPVNPLFLGYSVAQALDMPFDRQREGVKVGGCGMDMGFHLVYELSHALWPDGFGCVGEGCPSNDHNNGDRDYTKHEQPTRAGQAAHWHRDSGYALRQRWL